MSETPYSNNPGVADQDLSAWLMAQRKRAGLSQDQVCQRTKIHSKYISALEAGEYHLLPSATHVRSFALAYAKVCDADQKKAAELVGAALGRPSAAPIQPDEYLEIATKGRTVDRGPSPAPSPRVAREAGLPVAPVEESRWSLWVGMALGVALVLWFLTKLVPQPGARRVSSPPPPAAVPAAEAPVEKAQKKATPVPKKKPVKAAAPKAAPATLKPLDESDVAGPADEALTLRAKKDCWLVVEVDGQRKPVVILAEDEKKVWYFKQRLVMLAGNAGAVRAWWQGKSLGFLGAEGERKNGLVFESGKAMQEIESAALELPAGIRDLGQGQEG